MVAVYFSIFGRSRVKENVLVVDRNMARNPVYNVSEQYQNINPF
jgi:hypothetical protein